MALSKYESDLIKYSWSVMREEGVRNPLVFYDNFFELAPSARRYFPRSDFDKLQQKFRYTIDFLIEHCHELEQIQETIEDLGRTHNKLRISHEHYPMFNKSLINLLQKILDEECTEEITQAWSKALNLITNIMQNAPDKKENKFEKLLKKLFG